MRALIAGRRQEDYSIAPEFPRGDGTLSKWRHDDLEQVLLLLLLLLLLLPLHACCLLLTLTHSHFFHSGTSLQPVHPALTSTSYSLA